MKTEILSLARKLIAIRSVSPSRDENEVIAALEAYLRRAGVEILETPLARLPDGRRNLYARVRGQGRRCLLLSGHVDTVPISDYARYASYGCTESVALDPDRLGEILGPTFGRDRYLFGRGALDMKGAVATCAVLLCRLARERERLGGEVLFAAVCDEENASAGILRAVEFLKAYRDEEGVEYLGFVNTDYTSPLHPDDPTRHFYLGTIGKLLPAFLVSGRVSHVGEPFYGFSANLLASEIHRRVEMNTDLSEVVEGEATPPPSALKVEDLKTHYDVQTPRQAHLYYNVFTLHRDPGVVLAEMKRIALEAFDSVVERLDNQYEAYCRRAVGFAYAPLTWKPRVMTLAELESQLEARGVDTAGVLKEAIGRNEKADLRVQAREAVRALFEHLPDADAPAVIVYLAPPYYPGFTSSDDSPLVKAVRAVVARHRNDLPDLTVRRYYPYISDMSYVAFPEHLRSGLGAIEGNMPVWSSTYRLDLETIAALSMPGVNLGPSGFDAHKDTERVDVEYSFGVLPGLIEEVIRGVIGTA